MSRIQLKDGLSGILPSGQGNQQYVEYWRGNLWASVWASELIDTDDQPLQAAALNSLYKGIPAQLAVAMSTKDCDLRRLPLVANISDEGLALLRPESVRGILKALVIVADSTTMLRAGRRTTTDLERDLQGLRRDLLCNYEVVEYHPMWGKTLPTLVKKALELSDQLERRFAGPITGQQLEIDYHIVWSGNELVGDDGIFLHPNIPNWMVEQRGGMMAAQGDWPTIADRISRALGTYASLRGRPSTGFLALLGGIEAAIFQLPEKLNEVNDLFFKLARSLDILTCDITGAFAGQAMFDEFHLRESAEVRRSFASRIARLTNLFFCDHRFRFFSVEQLQEVERIYPFLSGGRYPTYVNLEVYKHHLDKATNVSRHLYHAEEQVYENPWDAPATDEAAIAREAEHRVAEAMAEIIIPDEVMQFEVESLIHLGGGRYATEDEARSLRPTKVGVGDLLQHVIL